MSTAKITGNVDPLNEGNYGRIARKAGLHPSHVSRVVRGVRGVSMRIAERIADAAGVTLDDLRRHIVASKAKSKRTRKAAA